MIRMRYKQAAKKGVEVTLTSGAMSKRRYKQVAKSCPGEEPIFDPPLGEIRAPGFQFQFQFRLIGGLVSVTFWLRFLLRSRLVPVASPENWFPLLPKRFLLHPAPSFCMLEPSCS